MGTKAKKKRVGVRRPLTVVKNAPITEDRQLQPKPTRLQERPPAAAEKADAIPVHPAEAERLELIREGKSLLSLLPAVSLTDELQTAFMGDGAILRRQLLREHGSDAASTMLADIAITAYVQSQQAGMTLNKLLAEGASKTTIDRAEKIDRIQDRAHRRMLSAIEALRRGGGGPAKMQIGRIEEVSNLCVGDQVVMKDDDT